MHSEVPNGNWDTQWVRKHYCAKKACQEQLTFDTLKGPEPKPPPMTQAEMSAMLDEILKKRKDKSL